MRPQSPKLIDPSKSKQDVHDNAKKPFLAERTSLPIHDQNCLTVLETGRGVQATESAVELKAGSWIGNDALFWLGHPKLPDAREVRISEINVCTRRAHAR